MANGLVVLGMVVLFTGYFVWKAINVKRYLQAVVSGVDWEEITEDEFAQLYAMRSELFALQLGPKQLEPLVVLYFDGLSGPVMVSIRWPSRVYHMVETRWRERMADLLL